MGSSGSENPLPCSVPLTPALQLEEAANPAWCLAQRGPPTRPLPASVSLSLWDTLCSPSFCLGTASRAGREWALFFAILCLALGQHVMLSSQAYVELRGPPRSSGCAQPMPPRPPSSHCIPTPLLNHWAIGRLSACFPRGGARLWPLQVPPKLRPFCPVTAAVWCHKDAISTHRAAGEVTTHWTTGNDRICVGTAIHSGTGHSSQRVEAALGAVLG